MIFDRRSHLDQLSQKASTGPRNGDHVRPHDRRGGAGASCRLNPGL